MGRREACRGRGASGAARPGAAVADPAHQRLHAQRTHLPGRGVEDATTCGARAGDDYVTGRVRGGPAGRLGAGGRAAESDLSVQGVRVHGAAAVPLAVFMLSEPRARPGWRLDARDLPALGGRARRVRAHPRQLVSRAGELQADDGSAGVRGRRQRRSHHHPGQGSGAGQAGGTGRLAVPEAPGRPRLRGAGARRRRRSGEPAAHAGGLADRSRHGAGRAAGGHRHVDRVV
jgi:hypothetical protein